MAEQLQERASALLAAATALREALADVPLPLDVPGVAESRQTAREVVDQLDDYALPRLRDLDAPLLVVVGGSTGAGKSTLINSLLGTTVSRPGVLRPTTRSPVLAHAPSDRDAFTGDRVLPGLSRLTGDSSDSGEAAGGGRTLRLVASDRVPAGLALLDAPDIDSVVSENRELAGQLLAAADLWVFVTTAARYADAVPWGLLQDAADRSAALAVVLDRVPPGAGAEITPHLSGMLADHRLGQCPVFVVEETALVDGRLPEAAVAPLREWLSSLASNVAARQDLVRRTLAGVLATDARRAREVADALETQRAAREALAAEVSDAYAVATRKVDRALEDGSVLRGEVLARWQEVVGTGELLRMLESRMGWLRDRVVSAVSGRPAADQRFSVALESGVENVVHSAADAAAERTVAAWRAIPGGALLLAPDPGALAHASPALKDQAARTVRDWQGAVLELVRREGAGRRTSARALSYGVNGAALVVMVAVFASTGGLTGSELLVAGGASALGQKVLEALLGDDAVRRLAATARADLVQRVAVLLDEEQARFRRRLGDLPTGTDPDQLRTAAARVQRALAGGHG